MATVETLSIDVKASVDKAVSSLKRFSGAMTEVKNSNDGAAKATKETTFAFEASASGLLKAANMLKGAGLKNLAKEYSKMAELVNFRGLEDATKSFLDAADQFAQKGDESTAKFIRDRANLVEKEREITSAIREQAEAEKALAEAQAKAQQIQETSAKSELAYVEITKKAQLEKADAILKSYTDMAARIAKENAASDKAYADLTKADRNKRADAKIKEILDAEKERQAQMAEYVRIAKESEAAYERIMSEEHNRQADSKIKKIIEEAEQATLKKAEADKKAEDAAKSRAEEEKKLTDELQKQADARNAESNKQIAQGLKGVKSAFKGLSNIMPSLRKRLFGVFRMFGRIAMYRAVRAAIKALTSALKEGLTNLKAYSKEVGTAFAPAVDNLRSHVLWLKNAIATALRPVIEALIPIIQRLVDWLVKASDFLAQVFSIMTGKVDDKGRYTKAVLTDIQESTEEAKRLQRTLLGFDEINRLDGENGKDNSQNAGLMFTQADVSDKAIEWAGKLTEWLGKIKEFIGEVDWEMVLKVLAALELVNILSKVVGWLKPIGSVLKILGGVLKKIIGFLGGGGGIIALVVAVTVAFGLWGDKIGEWFDTSKKKVNEFADKIKGFFGKSGLISAIIGFVSDAITLVMDFIGSIAKMFYKFAHGDFHGAFEELLNIGKILLKGAVGFILGILNIILGMVEEVANSILGAARWIWNTVLVPLINNSATTFKKAWVWIHNAFIDFRIAFNTVIKWILDRVNDALQWILDSINAAIASFNEVFGTDLKPIEFKIDTTFLDEKIEELEGKKLPPITETVQVVGEWKEPAKLKLQIDTQAAYAAIDNLGKKVNQLGSAVSSVVTAMGAQSKNRMIVTKYASGGFPSMGSIFVAGESGAEYIADINGRTGVYNTDQMSNAMYKAMVAALATMPQQGGDIYLDGEVIYRNTVRRNNNQVRATGRTALLT